MSLSTALHALADPDNTTVALSVAHARSLLDSLVNVDSLLYLAPNDIGFKSDIDVSPTLVRVLAAPSCSDSGIDDDDDDDDVVVVDRFVLSAELADAGQWLLRLQQRCRV